jgi:hypothetical protein
MHHKTESFINTTMTWIPVFYLAVFLFSTAVNPGPCEGGRSMKTREFGVSDQQFNSLLDRIRTIQTSVHQQALQQHMNPQEEAHHFQQEVDFLIDDEAMEWAAWHLFYKHKCDETGETFCAGMSGGEFGNDEMNTAYHAMKAEMTSRVYASLGITCSNAEEKGWN